MKLALTATPSAARFAPILLRGDIAGAFALAAELGYDGVELHLRQPGDIDRAAVRKLASDYGLGIPILGTGMAAGEDGLTFADHDPEIRRQAVERVKEHIALAAYLNSAVTIGLLSGWLGSDPQKRPVRRAAALACLEQCCQVAAVVGVTLLLEPLNRYECDYLNTVEDALSVIREIGLPNLKLLADTFHMNIEEVDIAASLRRAGPNLGHVHLVDSNRRAPGHGHLDVRGVLQALRDINYPGYLSFEVLPLPSPRQATEDAIRNVRDILLDL
jgi:sugar phosphate isomerase/epimerase